MKITQTSLSKKRRITLRRSCIAGKRQEAEKKYNEVKAKIDKETPALNKQVISEMQALGYHLGAIDTQNRLEKYNEFKAQLPDEQHDLLDSPVGKIWDGSLWNKFTGTASAVLLCRYCSSSWIALDSATTIAASHGGAEVLAVVGVKRIAEDDLAFRRRCFGICT